MHFRLSNSTSTVNDYTCVYLKACFSKVLSEVCSNDSLQEPSQGDDVGVASCPESDQRSYALVG